MEGERSARELFGGEEPRNTKERILCVALDLFATHGFHAVGLDRILAETGVSKTTFYNHYPSKEDLVLAAVKTRDGWESAAFGRQVQERGGYEPRAMLLAMFDVLDTWFNHPDYQGCLFLNATAEFPSPDDPIHQAAAEHYEGAKTMIAQLGKAAGVDDPQAFADEWQVLLKGAVSHRMVGCDDGAARVARGVAERLLEARAG